MKTIELKILPRTGENNPEVNYRTELLSIVRRGGTNGITMDVVRKSLDLLNLLEGTLEGGTLELADDEHSILVLRMATATWGGVFTNLVQFFDDVERAPARRNVQHNNGNQDSNDEDNRAGEGAG